MRRGVDTEGMTAFRAAMQALDPAGIGSRGESRRRYNVGRLATTVIAIVLFIVAAVIVADLVNSYLRVTLRPLWAAHLFQCSVLD